ncbi:2'-5' RNA ligase [Chromatiales bacterium (ex Bugula neritina AB1)]|nr:2'-5' RNA ligase [Chromatiales bacterium (ex Bugula neritina AB1)]
MKRTFFAVTPDAQTCIEVDKWCALCWPQLQRRVAVQNYHVTLAFLGDTSDKQQQLFEEYFESCNIQAFSLILNDLGFWPDSSVLWLAPKQVPAGLLSLADSCKRIANRAGLKVNRRSYQPHLTLARKTTMPPAMPLLEPDFRFEVDSMQLYESIMDRDGVRYRELRCWRLLS